MSVAEELAYEWAGSFDDEKGGFLLQTGSLLVVIGRRRGQYASDVGPAQRVRFVSGPGC